MAAMVSSTHASHAVVVGGSMAGLLAARVLTDHFAKVTLIERDRFPDSVENRRGVPQGPHAHGLLAEGKKIMSRLFPDLAATLIEGGSVMVDLGAEMRWHHFGGYKVQFQSGLVGLSQSRPFLEWHVRRRVLALENLECLLECDARELVASSDHTRITGVKIQRRSTRGDERLDAHLVVDAMGRGSPSPKWIEWLGYPKPEETVIKIGVGYASRIYRRRPGDLQGDKLLIAFPTPPRETRMGALFPIEGDRWLLTLGGWVGDHPPVDEEGFLEFARSLPAPDIYDFITRAEPLTGIVPYKFPSNLRRRYEDMVRLPEGYIVLGDALCSLNPIYAQGMTVSALEAAMLDECLREQWRRRGDLIGFPRRFFRRVAKVVDMPWMLTAGEDFRYPQVEGTRAPSTTFINWYVSKVHQVATYDRKVYGAFLKVINLIEPPTMMFRPRVLLRVLKGSLSSRRKLNTPVRGHPALTNDPPC